jgi:glycosyltransferase involved in cell wall biosynthesis
MKKLISIVVPCYNEEENVLEMAMRIRDVMRTLPDYDYENIFIDNASSDRTVEILKREARKDHRVKIIVNARNFGYIRSPYYGLMQARGDAVVTLAADLQEPPELIREFVANWERGSRVVAAVKTASRESPFLYYLRGVYYRTIRKFGTVDMLDQFSGFGLYDRKVLDVMRGLREPYPYLRGLVADVGCDISRVEFIQAARLRGQAKGNFYALFDLAMLGFTNYTKIPLRVATILGFLAAGVSFLIGVGYLVAKLCFWYTFSAGMAPVLIGLCFIGSVQLFFLGIVGEYVGTIFTYVQNRPLVIEKERINFDDDALGDGLAKGGQ